MRSFLSLVDALVGIVGSFIGAMSSTQLAELAAVVRRWRSRISLWVWPDAEDPNRTKPRRPPRAR